MDMAIGFDTSCYTTSVAAVDERGRVVDSFRMLLPVASGQRGLRQSEAVFVHVKQVPQVMEKLSASLAKVDVRICAVSAAHAPREDAESYMPVFTVGLGHAKVLAGALQVPLYQFSHQQGHIAAGQVDGADMGARFVALHLSGGTTDLLLSEQGKLSQLGGSLDLHAGQLVDRIGVAMGLPFPAGPSLEELALRCAERAQAILPVSMADSDLHCHLSGAEAQCDRLLKSGTLSQEEIALEVFDFLTRTVIRLLQAGCDAAKCEQALVVGGVASSLLLRRLIGERLQKSGSPMKVVFGKPEYSGDNAVGIALLGMKQLKERRKAEESI